MDKFYLKSLINPERVKIKMGNMVYTFRKIAGAALFHFSHDKTSDKTCEQIAIKCCCDKFYFLCVIYFISVIVLDIFEANT